MPISYQDELVLLEQNVGVEEAETLLEWLQQHPAASADLRACSHLHAANLQVLMAAGVTISAWPTDATLAGWLKSALDHKPE
jgi:hypothetical protein